jgi:RNA polymerase sigma-70 factor (ECF subfamily)
LSHFNQTIDQVTFKAACKNKTLAQKKVYEQYVQPVYNLVLRITQNSSDALDITQDVFIKVFAKIGQSKKPDLLGFWIRKIAVNTTMTYLKKNAHLITNVDFKEKSYESNSYETLTSIEFALSKLSEVSRSILWLYEVEGMTHEEIAKLHGMTVSFSKTHLSRAKKQAQIYLTQKGGGYEAIS